MNIEASVTSLDCNHGVCPQTQGAVTCTITGSTVAWYSPPSDSNLIATVKTSGEVSNVGNTGFTAAFVTNNSGLTTNLSFTATADKNGTQVRCLDGDNRNSMICTIMISGMSLIVSYITNMYYHYKTLQVILLQDWVLQLSQTLQLLSIGHLLLFILTVYLTTLLRSGQPVIIY